MSADPWSAYLEALESWTAEQSRLLAATEAGEDVPLPSPPALPQEPLDEARAARAREVLRDVQALTAHLEHLKAGAALELQELRRRTRPQTAPTSVYVSHYS